MLTRQSQVYTSSSRDCHSHFIPSQWRVFTYY